MEMEKQEPNLFSNW